MIVHQSNASDAAANRHDEGMDMTNWYTADTHFGHDNIIKHCNRPFRFANHMDAVLMQNLWAMVRPKDALWIVGDFAFGQRAKDEEWLAQLFSKLPGAEKHLVVGNPWGAPKDGKQWTDARRFVSIRRSLRLPTSI